MRAGSILELTSIVGRNGSRWQEEGTSELPYPVLHEAESHREDLRRDRRLMLALRKQLVACAIGGDKRK